MMDPKKFEFAETTEIEYLSIWVDEIMDVMCRVCGCEPPIFISDQSLIGDMPPEDEELKKMAEELGIPIDGRDLIIDLAKRLKKSRE